MSVGEKTRKRGGVADAVRVQGMVFELVYLLLSDHERSTKKTLTEISYECGFSSRSYFNCAFKRRMGVTPRAYAAFAKRYEDTP